MARGKPKGGGRKPPANRGTSRNTRGSSSLSPVKSNHSTDSPFGIPDDIGTADNTTDAGGGGNSLATPGEGIGDFGEQQDGFDPALLLGQLGQDGGLDLSGFEGQMEDEVYDEGGAPDASFLDELERGLGLKEGDGEDEEGEEGDIEMLGESQSGGALEDEEEEDEDGEDEEDAEEGDEDEDGEDEEDEEDGEDEDGEEDEEAEDEDDDGTQRDEWVDCPEEIVFRYPAAVPDFTTLDEREQQFKVARFMRCQAEDCTCEGLEPPMSSSPELREVSREALDSGDMEELEVPDGVEDGAVEKWRSEEGWWRRCGRCGHGWEVDGHVFDIDEAAGEKVRKGRVVGRIEELLQVSQVAPNARSSDSADGMQDRGMLTTFPTPQTKEVASLLKQLHHFVRPSGKKPAGPLPAALDLASPGASGSVGTPMSPHDSDDERPRKRSRKDGSADEVEDQDEDVATSPQQGKKPGGKQAGKGTKPRTVVRGARGLIPMETEADGSQHPAGDIPESAKPGGGVGGEEDDEEDVPLAKRPELDERERKRRELAKEKAREKEDEVVRRLTKGVNVDEGAAVDPGDGPAVEVEVWEGVELVSYGSCSVRDSLLLTSISPSYHLVQLPSSRKTKRSCCPSSRHAIPRLSLPFSSSA